MIPAQEAGRESIHIAAGAQAARASLDELRRAAHLEVEMRARWASFAVGLWLVLAPVALGYGEVGTVLHDVTFGLLVSVGALASLEWPAVRFALAAPAGWLVVSRSTLALEPAVAANHLACGLALLALTLVPSGKLALAREGAKAAA